MSLPDNFLENMLEDEQDRGVMLERLRICKIILAHAERQDLTTNYGKVVFSELKAVYDEVTQPIPDTIEGIA